MKRLYQPTAQTSAANQDDLDAEYAEIKKKISLDTFVKDLMAGKHIEKKAAANPGRFEKEFQEAKREFGTPAMARHILGGRHMDKKEATTMNRFLDKQANEEEALSESAKAGLFAGGIGATMGGITGHSMGARRGLEEAKPLLQKDITDRLEAKYTDFLTPELIEQKNYADSLNGEIDRVRAEASRLDPNDPKWEVKNGFLMKRWDQLREEQAKAMAPLENVKAMMEQEIKSPSVRKYRDDFLRKAQSRKALPYAAAGAAISGLAAGGAGYLSEKYAQEENRFLSKQAQRSPYDVDVAEILGLPGHGQEEPAKKKPGKLKRAGKLAMLGGTVTGAGLIANDLQEKQASSANRFLIDSPTTELDKEASVLGALGLAGAMHIAPNLSMKAVKSTEAGHRALAGTLAAGVKHGREGKMLQPNARALVEYGVGPETLVDYGIGRRLGKRLGKYEDNPERQEVFLNRVKSKFNLNDLDDEGLKQLDKVPVLGSVNRFLKGDTNKKVEAVMDRFAVPEAATLTKGQKAGNLAMLGAAGAVDPHILMQPAFSAGRKQLAKSSIGKKMLEKNFDEGMKGKQISKGKERVIDTLVSPGVLDTHRVGNFLHNNADQKTLEKAKEFAPKLYNV